MSRDDFAIATKEVLAKRVAYLCSNPNCRTPTVGPNEEPDKATSIGVAAHITAASPGGPRFDESLEPGERKDINNGIWLCANCSVLIDRNENEFSEPQLRDWKSFAEDEALKGIKGVAVKGKDLLTYLDVDLKRSTGGRMNRGFSTRNPIVESDGIKAYDISKNPIVIWELFWNFNLVIYNNSQSPAYNLAIRSVDNSPLAHLADLPEINNLAPLENIEIGFGYKSMYEGTKKEAVEVSRSRIVELLNSTLFELTYQDSARTNQKIVIRFEGESLKITR